MKHYPLKTVLILTFAAFIVGIIAASQLGVMEKSQAVSLGSDKSGTAGASLDQPLTMGSFRQVAEQQNPTVVNISTKKVIKPRESMNPHGQPQGNGNGGEPYFFDFFGRDFRDFFDNFAPKEFTQQSLGSGFIVDKDGFILTNNHVVEDADEIIVKLLNDEKEYPAKVMGRDPKTDLALIKIDGAKNLQAAALGDSESLHVGDWVIAIGNPFGWSHTVTVGVVSALGRSIGQGPYDQYIQTDASINPGNSGGPLFDYTGKVIGVNTAIATRTGGFQGIGFAIPINIVKKLIPQLKEGEVVRGWIGVTIQKIDGDLASKFGLTEAKGALINSVLKGSPADKAGLEQGDIIVEFDGKKIAEFSDLSRIVADTAVGASLKVKVIRSGKEKMLTLTVGKYPKDEDVATMQKTSFDIGLDLQDLTPQIAVRLRLPEDTHGVLIAGVQAGSRAEEAGLQRGDIITSVERQPVDSVTAFYDSMKKLESGKPILLLIQREAQSFFVTIKAAK
jgi:serine protease Do